MHAYWERVSGEGTSEGESDQAGKDVQKDEKVEKDQTQTQELCGFQKVVRQEPKIEASQAPPVQSVTKPIWNPLEALLGAMLKQELAPTSAEPLLSIQCAS